MELARPIVLKGRPNKLSRKAKGGWTGGEDMGQLHRLAYQIGVRSDATDQAPFERLPGGDALAQQHHLHRPHAPDHPREEVGRAAVRHEPNPAKRLQEVSALRRHDQVAKQGERAAHAGGRAVHRGDERCRHLPHEGHQRIVDGLQGRAGVRLAVDIQARPARVVREVGARAEAAPLACQNDGARLLGPAAGVLERMQELARRIYTRRVHRRRIGYGDHRNRPVAAHLDLLVGHFPSPPLTRARRANIRSKAATGAAPTDVKHCRRQG